MARFLKYLAFFLVLISQVANITVEAGKKYKKSKKAAEPEPELEAEQEMENEQEFENEFENEFEEQEGEPLDAPLAAEADPLAAGQNECRISILLSSF